MKRTLGWHKRVVGGVALAVVAAASVVGDVVDTRLTQLVQRHIDAPWPNPNDPVDPTWGLSTYALAALYANTNVATANNYINLLHASNNVPAGQNAGIDFPVYFPLHLLWRIYCDTNMNARLTATARDNIEDMMWCWVDYRSEISQAEGGAWQIRDSENHDAMQKGSHLLCCQALMHAGAPYGPDRVLRDGHTLREHYEAWTAYWYEYFRQRAREGINCEMASPTYSKYSAGVYYNVRDYAESPGLREMAERFINLYWADTVCDFISSGVRGGAETRCYKDESLFRGDNGSFTPMLWAYTWHANYNPLAGSSSPYTLITATSSYRVPEIITACATNADRPPYRYLSRRFGLTDAVVINSINKVIFGPGMSSDLRRESFITKDYAMGTLTLNQTNDYIQLIDQNRAMGVMFAAGPNDRIMVYGEGESPDFIKGYREITGVCRANCMIVSRDRNAPSGADTYVYVSPGSVWTNRNETNGWFFTRTGNAYCGIKPATMGYTVSNLAYGTLLVLGDNFAPIVIQTGQAQDYGGSFAAFQNHVLSNTFTFVSPLLTYVSEAGDTLAVNRRSYNTPVINGLVEDLNPPKTYDSPYLSMVHGESVATFSFGAYSNLVLDFEVPAAPAVAVNPATAVGLTNATLNGAVLVSGGSPPDVLLYWDVADRGTNAGWAHTNDLGLYEVGPVATNLTGLTPNVRYFYRFCATNIYGADWSFPTNFLTLGKPVVSNAPATGIGETEATLNGTLLDTAGMPTEVVLFWGVSNGLTNGNWGHTNAFGSREAGPLTTNVTGLSPNTRYYYAFYATNAYGTGWAAVSNFTTVGAPVLTNYAVTGLEMTNATFNGELLDDSGLPTHVYLFWSTTTKSTNSVNWPNTNDVGVVGVGPLTTTVTRLTPDKKHWYAFCATNAYGTGWSRVATLTTKGPPSIQNDPATGIGVSNAVLNGTVNSTGGVPTQVYVFWDTADRGTNAAGWAHTNAFGTQKEVSLATNITGLISNTFYAYRFYATNLYGGSWATNPVGFKTLLPPICRWFEAESGVITAPMTMVADSSASGGAYVWVPDALGYTGGYITFPFSSVVATNYTLLMRVSFPDGNGNSFFASMDGGANLYVQGGLTGVWYWITATNYSLGAGNHSLAIIQREDGAKLDCMLLISGSNDVPTNVVSSVPSDIDADGIPDVWMQRYFRQPTGQVGALSRPGDDQDGDGLSNWGEYIGGSNPTNGADVAGLSIAWTNGRPQLWFTARQTSGFGYAGLSRYFALSNCWDLLSGAWNPVPGATNVIGVGQTVTYPIVTPVPVDFYRLTIELR